MPTDFLPFYPFTFKSHADCADDADFLPLKVPTRISRIFYFLKVPQAVPARKIWRGKEASCPQAVPARKTWRGL